MERDSGWLALIPVFFLILVFFYPLFRISIDAFFVDTLPTLATFPRILAELSIRRALTFTLTQAAISTVFSVTVGFPLGFILSRYLFPGKYLLKALLLLPFMTPPTIVVLGFILLYGPKGMFSSFIPQLKILSEGFYSIIAAHVFYNAPLAAYYVFSTLKRLGPEMEEASDSLGASPYMKFLKIFLPHSLPGLLSSSILIFLYCFTSFTIPLVLGGIRYRTLEVEIYSLYKVFFDHSGAAALSLIQFLVLGFISFTYLKFFILRAERIEPGYGEKLREIRVMDVPPVRRFLIIAYVFLMMFFFLSPLAAVILRSFLDVYTGRFTVKPFSAVFSSTYNPYLGTSPLNSICNTLIFSFIAALLTVFNALLASLQRSAFYSTLVNTPLMVSSITLALGLYRAYGTNYLIYQHSWILIVLSYTVIALPLAHRIVSSGISRIPEEIFEAAKTLGSDDIDILLRIKLPLSWDGVFSAFLLSLALGMSEFAITLFLSRPEYSTMTVAMYRFMSSRRFQEASCMGSLLLVLSGAIFYLGYKVGGEAYGISEA